MTEGLQGSQASPGAVLRTEQFVLDEAREFLEPLTRRSIYRRSRLAVLRADGSTMPVIELLAVAKFKHWEEEQFPFWIDGDYRNETLANVGLATRAAGGVSRPTSSLGVPAGTKEYMRLWRERNRSRVRETQQRYAAKQKAVLSRVREAAIADPVLEKLLRAVKGTD
jgi:hypothetical protein